MGGIRVFFFFYSTPDDVERMTRGYGIPVV